MNFLCRLGWHDWRWLRGPFGYYRICVRTPSHR